MTLFISIHAQKGELGFFLIGESFTLEMENPTAGFINLNETQKTTKFKFLTITIGLNYQSRQAPNIRKTQKDSET